MTSKDIWELNPNYQSAMDIRGEPTKICPCGCFVWKLLVCWSDEDDTIASYFTDMECASCGTKATTPMEGKL